MLLWELQGGFSVPASWVSMPIPLTLALLNLKTDLKGKIKPKQDPSHKSPIMPHCINKHKYVLKYVSANQVIGLQE